MPSLAEAYYLYEPVVTATQMGLASFGMGCMLHKGDFSLVAKRPVDLVIGWVALFLLGPLIAITLGRISPVTEGTAMGMVLVTAMPGGALSNLFTFLAKGNAALSICLTATATLASLVVTPIIFAVGTIGLGAADVALPAQKIALDVLLFVLMPMFLGMGVNSWRPKQAPLVSRWSIRCSVAFLIMVIVGAVGRLHGNPPNLVDFLIPIALCCLSGAAAIALSVYWRRGRAQTSAIYLESVVRNGNLALLVALTLLPQDDPRIAGLVGAVLIYGGTAMVFACVGFLSDRRKALASSPPPASAPGSH